MKFIDILPSHPLAAIGSVAVRSCQPMAVEFETVYCWQQETHAAVIQKIRKNTLCELLLQDLSVTFSKNVELFK